MEERTIEILSNEKLFGVTAETFMLSRLSRMTISIDNENPNNIVFKDGNRVVMYFHKNVDTIYISNFFILDILEYYLIDYSERHRLIKKIILEHLGLNVKCIESKTLLMLNYRHLKWKGEKDS